MYTDGGIESQPDWFMELLAWFIPIYSDSKFYSRVKAVLGDQPKDAKPKDVSNPNRQMPPRRK